MADMPPPPGFCVVDLFHGQQVPAQTIVKGYMVCQAHVSFEEDFFRRWEAIQDPKQLDKTEKKLLKKLLKRVKQTKTATTGGPDVAP